MKEGLQMIILDMEQGVMGGTRYSQNQWQVGPWNQIIQPQRAAREDSVADREVLKLVKVIRR